MQIHTLMLSRYVVDPNLFPNVFTQKDFCWCYKLHEEVLWDFDTIFLHNSSSRFYWLGIVIFGQCCPKPVFLIPVQCFPTEEILVIIMSMMASCYYFHHGKRGEKENVKQRLRKMMLVTVVGKKSILHILDFKKATKK